MTLVIRRLQPDDIASCSAINRSLPRWFGLEEGLHEADEYLHNHTGLIAAEAGKIVGYLTWHQLFPESAEISWMAVTAIHHRQGVGQALIAALEDDLRRGATRLLSVKTLASTHPSPEYAITRAFYTAIGFHSQMVFPDLWDAANPCLLMVKHL